MILKLSPLKLISIEPFELDGGENAETILISIPLEYVWTWATVIC